VVCFAAHPRQNEKHTMLQQHLRCSLRFITALLAMAVLVGCGSAPPAAPAATIAAAPLPGDWQRIDTPQFAVAVPPQWTAMTSEDANIVAGAELVAQNPDLGTLIDRGMAELAAGQVVLVAYDLDPDNATGFTTNLRIGRQTFEEAPALEQIASANQQDLEAQAGFSAIERATVTIGDASAVRLNSKLALNDAVGQPLTLAMEQYLVIDENNVYVITFTVPDNQRAAYRATFDTILSTLRFK
jgi:hypothetical protein